MALKHAIYYNEKYPHQKEDRVNALLLNYILSEKLNFIVDPFHVDFGIDTLTVFQISFTGKTYIILLASGKHHNFSKVVQSKCTSNIFLNNKCLQNSRSRKN